MSHVSAPTQSRGTSRRRASPLVVLTADRTLMARYDVLLDGMMAASQTTTTTPWLVMDRLLLPRAPHWNGQAQFAPLGLRRIEAALVAAGFDSRTVAVVDDAHLQDAIGADTRIVALSAGEPCGLGMSSTTMAAIAGGQIWPHVLFRRLVAQVRELVAQRAPRARVVMGGPGAWQLAQHEDQRRTVGIDHVVLGYADANAAAIFEALLDGEELSPVIQGAAPAARDIPPILRPSTMGVVEISRGCGLGCAFCTLANTPMVHLPPDRIIADVVTNVTGGMTSICALSEDFLRYGARGTRCRPEATLELLDRMREIGGLRLIQVDHLNVTSIAQYTDAQLAEVRELLNGPVADRAPWVNVGVETAAGELLAANGGATKMGEVAPDHWGGFCAEQIRRLSRAGFVPMVSLLIGLPGETAEHVAASLEWVRALKHEAITIFPVLYAPIDGSPPPSPKNLTRLHWRLIRECYELNFQWVPRIYWDDQTAAGASPVRRALLQMLGRSQIGQWRTLLSAHARRAAA